MRIQTQIPHTAHIDLELKACHIKINKIAATALDITKGELRAWAFKAIKDTQAEIKRLSHKGSTNVPCFTALRYKHLKKFNH